MRTGKNRRVAYTCFSLGGGKDVHEPIITADLSRWWFLLLIRKSRISGDTRLFRG